MNYTRIYNELINHRKLIKPDGYKEAHHIIPKCMDGLDTEDNLVDLTAREHFICHYLLTKMYPNHKGVQWASGGMRRNKNKHNGYYNARLYASMKGKYKHTEEHRQYMSKINKGKKLSEEHKQKISKTRLQRKIPGLKGDKNGMFGKTLSQEARKKISENSKNYWKNLSDEQRQRIKQERSERLKGNKNPSFGKPMSEEAKRKMLDTRKRNWEKLTEEEKKERQEKFKKSLPHLKGELNGYAKTMQIKFKGQTWVIKGTVKDFCKDRKDISVHALYSLANGRKLTPKSRYYGWEAKYLD